MMDYLILILLLVVVVILFWLGCKYATINTTEQWQESVLKNYERGYEDAVDKAYEWLCEFNRKQANKMFGTVHTADVTINVAEFRKAMEGE